MYSGCGTGEKARQKLTGSGGDTGSRTSHGLQSQIYYDLSGNRQAGLPALFSATEVVRGRLLTIMSAMAWPDK